MFFLPICGHKNEDSKWKMKFLMELVLEPSEQGPTGAFPGQTLQVQNVEQEAEPEIPTENGRSESQDETSGKRENAER